MKTVKNNLLPTISMALLFLISGMNILIGYISGNDVNRQVFFVLIGFLLILFMSFLKEEHFFKASIPAYILSVIILAIPVLTDDSLSGRFLSIGYYYYYVPAFAPLTMPLIARSAVKTKDLSHKNFICLCLLALLPIGLVLIEPNLPTALMAFAAFSAFVVYLKSKDKLKISWRALIIPVVALAAAFVLLYPESTYLSRRIETILTRGANDPLGSGWVRTALDGIFMNTPLIGSTRFSAENIEISKLLGDWGSHNIVVMLSEYGWLAFIITVLLFAAFFFLVFKMISKIKKNTYAKSIALFSGILLLVQSIFSLIGLILLDSSLTDFPFLSSHHTVNIMNYILVAVILNLYIKRDKPTEMEQLIKISEEYPSLLREVVPSMLFDDLSGCDYDSDDLDLDDDIEEDDENPADTIEQ